MTTIRKATDGDAEGIREAFLRSLREVCAKDHTPEEILAWGSRPQDEVRRLMDIQNEHVWVLELDGRIEGFAHLHLSSVFGRRLGQVHGLYLTPEAMGQGFGKKLAAILIEEAKKFGAAEIRLESTLNAHAFYRGIGFQYDGDPTTAHLGSTVVRCIPMQMVLRSDVQ
jgi:N-acetylglutamate synthase-like GNAT family acetyltransferase